MMSSLYLIISLLIILTLSTLIATEIHLHIKKNGYASEKNCPMGAQTYLEI